MWFISKSSNTYEIVEKVDRKPDTSSTNQHLKKLIDLKVNEI